MADQVELRTVTLDNGKEYIVASKIEYENKIYYYLVNTLDNKDIMIRKLVQNNEGNELTTVSEEEFEAVVKLFLQKYKGGE